MSHNLTLYIGPADVGLYQTPTEVTQRARYARADIASRTSESGDFANAKAVYFAWLDEWVEEGRPAIHPRASNAQRKAIMSTPAWREYVAFREQIAEHKAKVEQALLAGATWGST
jgi:hypothetical protein